MLLLCQHLSFDAAWHKSWVSWNIIDQLIHLLYAVISVYRAFNRRHLGRKE